MCRLSMTSPDFLAPRLDLGGGVVLEVVRG